MGVSSVNDRDEAVCWMCLEGRAGGGSLWSKGKPL